MSTREPDRDRSIEEMLRRTSRSAVAGDPSNRCLDAEILAAWIDGDLSAADVSAAEAHVSSCARCQAMVAAIVRTTPLAPAPVPWWRRGWAIGALVPLTAGVAAIAIWIATPDVQQREAPAVATVQQAPADIAAPSAREQTLERRRQVPQQSVAPLPPPAATPQAEAKRYQSVPPPNTDLRARVDDASRRRVADMSEARKELSDAAKRDGSPAATVAPAAPPPPPAPLAATEAAGAAFRGSAAAVTPQRANESATAALAKPAYVQPLTETVSPDRSVRWRPGASGSIQRSTDGGATWTTLSSGVTEDLVAGSAPSSTACWIVGRRGTVLLTTDGVQWRRITFPESVDLVAVQATDLATATVTANDGRRFRTADGGQTWTRQ